MISIDACRNQRTGNATITVTDTDTGIQPDKAEAIFERFYKADEFVPGFGLGLALSQAYAIRLGGSIRLICNKQIEGCQSTIDIPHFFWRLFRVPFIFCRSAA